MYVLGSSYDVCVSFRVFHDMCVSFRVFYDVCVCFKVFYGMFVYVLGSSVGSRVLLSSQPRPAHSAHLRLPAVCSATGESSDKTNVKGII